MEVLRISPRGYCYGVVDAMVLAQQIAKDKNTPRPIYILGMIVHNQHIVDAFEKEGIHTVDGENRLDILEKITTGTVIFTAHGVSPEVRKRAYEKGLHVVDATCPDVTKTHDLIRIKTELGYHIVYIGKKGHPEPEGAIGVAPEHVTLISSVDEARALKVEGEKILITNQTTMSQWDVAEIVAIVTARYPHAEFHREICLATQVRQEAVAEQGKSCDLVIVVGDPKSNNSNRLAQVSEEIAGVRAYRISDLSELNIEWLKGIKRVGVTSGASTPTPITKEVIDFLESYDESLPETTVISPKTHLRILPHVKEKVTG